jgi:hypothetical protein
MQVDGQCWHVCLVRAAISVESCRCDCVLTDSILVELVDLVCARLRVYLL